MTVDMEILSAVLAALAWIAGGVTVIVGITWKAGRQVQGFLDRLELHDRTLRDHEFRLRKLEGSPENGGKMLNFPKSPLKT